MKNRTVLPHRGRNQSLVELSTPDTDAITDLGQLNRLFATWVETVYHVRVHSQTGMAPLRRWRDGIAHPIPTPTSVQLREAFLWSAHRTVNRTATVSLHNNVYQVDPVLVGRRVELVFDPFDLADVEVRYGGRIYGTATVFRLGRHSHPTPRPRPSASRPPPGIDYLRLVDTAHLSQLGERINYDAIAATAGQAEPDDSPESTS